MPKVIQVSINADMYIAQLEASFAASLASMRHTLRAIEDGSFISKAGECSPKSVLQIRIATTEANCPEAITRACNNCFIELIRAFITFLDRMIALQRVTKKQLKLGNSWATAEELLEYVKEVMESEYLMVAQDTQLRNPDKIAMFHNLPDFPKRAALSYFSVRKCLEHHSGQTAKSIVMHYTKPVVTADGEEIQAFPIEVQKGTEIGIRMSREYREWKKGEIVELNEAIVDHVYFTIRHVIAPQIKQTSI